MDAGGYAGGNKGDILIEVRKGTFQSSFDKIRVNPLTWGSEGTKMRGKWLNPSLCWEKLFRITASSENLVVAEWEWSTRLRTRALDRFVALKFLPDDVARDFKGEAVPATGSWDADYIRDVRMCLTGDQSRCARAPELFPLTTEEQKQYEFRFMGRETLRGRAVYHIGIAPKKTNPLSL